MAEARMLLPILYLPLLILLSLSPLLAHEGASPSVRRGWQKEWEFALPADSLSALLVDFSGEGQVRLVSVSALRGDLLVLVGSTAVCRVQLWRQQR
jgi:hypothetical protein